MKNNKVAVFGLAGGLILSALLIGIVDAARGDWFVLLTLGATILIILFLGVSWPRDNR